mmetsp:Transcript_136990/g.263293  ORF Transcript_136990/g.263293 Transcript_136990/m.263293 type:complete len:221 (+) Transcript_136990:711-1373(+)
MFSYTRRSALVAIMAALPLEASEHPETDVVVPLGHDAFTADVATSSSEEWIVLFCSDSEEPCTHLSQSYKQLSVVWNRMSLLSSSSHLGEVNCASSATLCSAEGVTVIPTAVHYLNGKRVAAWTMKGQDRSSLYQLMAWIKSELGMDVGGAAPGKKAADAKQARTSQVVTPAKAFIPLFAEMDLETAAIGYCLIFGVLGLIGWVIVEGFELWPSRVQSTK